MQQPYQPRSQTVTEAYKTFRNTKPDNTFNLAEETIVREFVHWVIIESRFPYDNIAKVNHLLITKEVLDAKAFTQSAAKAELETIKETLAAEHTYDACIENFPKAASVPNQHHIHLIVWHGS